MSDEPDDEWMDDESHASLKAALSDAYAESARLRAALRMIESAVPQLERWSDRGTYSGSEMEQNDSGGYLDRDDVTRLVAEAIRQSTGNTI